MALLRCAVFVAVFAAASGKSARHTEQFSLGVSVHSKTAMPMEPKTVPAHLRANITRFEDVHAGAIVGLLEQTESGLLMVWRSIVSSAKRRHWLPRGLGIMAEQPIYSPKEEKQDRQKRQIEQQREVPLPAAAGGPVPLKHDGSDRWVQIYVGSISVVLIISIYAIGFARFLWVYHYPAGPDAPHAYLGDGDSSSRCSDSEVNADKEKGQEAKPGSDDNVRKTVVLEGGVKWETTGCIELSTDDLFDAIGVSAMSIVDANQTAGVSQLPNKIAVPLISLQSVLMQGGLLWYMLLQLVPRNVNAHEEHPLPHCIVFIAVYLHFLNCIQEIPYSMQLIRHFGDFHKELNELLVMGGVLITDALVVPTLAFVLGSLYICTSKTIGDVILNAVAVAFVCNIDNWVLTIDNRTNFLAGRIESSTINLPVSAESMRAIAWVICYVPVLPATVSLAMCWLSFNVLYL